MKTLENGSLPASDLADIRIPPRLREVDENWVAVMAETMKTVGQLQEIVLRKDGDTLVLVDGAHRLAAAKLAALPHVSVRIVQTTDDDEATELEAIANVARHELTALDRAIHLGALRDIHSRRNPAARRNGDRRRQQEDAAERGVQILHFAPTVSEKLKLSRRSVYNFLSLYDKLTPAVVKRIQGTALADNFTELQLLSREAADDQGAILDLLSGDVPKAKNVAQAVSIHHNQVDASTPDERHFAQFVKIWARASKKARKQIAAHIAKFPNGEEA